MRADAACGRGTPSIALRLVGGAVLWPVCEGGTAPLSRARSPPGTSTAPQVFRVRENIPGGMSL